MRVEPLTASTLFLDGPLRRRTATAALRIQAGEGAMSKRMTGAARSVIDVLNRDRPRHVLVLASNPTVSEQTGWPIGFWWAELTHPYWEFAGRGYQVQVASPEGGPLRGDSWSDPRDNSKYSADDLISLGFITSREHMKLVEESKSLADVRVEDYDALLVIGGQGPMYTFYENDSVHGAIRDFYEAGKPTAVICHATCALLKTRLSDGRPIVEERTWTGFANSEERFADEFVGQKIQPFWIEDEARKLPNTNFIVNGPFKPFALRDGNLITGQQQHSGAAAAQLVIEALGQ